MSGTRTNFYKNPSLVYRKDFSLDSVLQNLKGTLSLSLSLSSSSFPSLLSAYNAATGNPSSSAYGEPPPTTNNSTTTTDHPYPHSRQRKRKHDEKPRNPPEEEGQTSFSHEAYIQKIKKETISSLFFLDKSPDALVTSDNPCEPIMKCEAAHPDESDRVKERHEQRFPIPGEPVCVVCGRYGEYICDKTGDDICSIDCKTELLELQDHSVFEETISHKNTYYAGPKVVLQIPELEKHSWDFDRNRWTKKDSELCAYKCWKCRRPGHLAVDCLVQVGSSSQTCEQEMVPDYRSRSVSKDLQALYKRCHQIDNNSTTTCNTCHSSFSLAMCLDCSMVFCDSSGHLDAHINTNPSHQRFYSYKLKRLVKCCKSTCNVTEIKDLLVCHYCFDKAFDKFYDMYTATWKVAGLSIIWGSICCDDHFTWHRMNCDSADVDGSAYLIDRCKHGGRPVEISDFIF